MFFSAVVFSAQSADAAQSYRVNAGQSGVKVDEYGVCKEISNVGTKDILIPTKTSAEWSGFLAHLPSGVTVANCQNIMYGVATTMSAGSHHTCVVKTNGNVYCWGDNSKAESSPAYTGGKAIAVSAGYLNSCALLSDGNVDCWGWNQAGKSNDYNGGDAIGVSTGYGSTCVIKRDYTMTCWGDSLEYSQLPTVNVVSIPHVIVNDKCAVTSSNAGKCGGYLATGIFNPNVSNTGVVSAADGDFFVCWLDTSRNVACQKPSGWSLANYTSGDAIGIGASAYAVCALRTNGNVYCWKVSGFNDSSISTGYSSGNAIAVSVAAWHACALTSSGNVYCWGTNSFGQANSYTNGDVRIP